MQEASVPSSPLLAFVGEHCGAALLDRLYGEPAAAAAIFRHLDGVAQYAVQRLLLADGGAVPLDALRALHRPALRARQNGALLQLKRLHIVQGRSGRVGLHATFQRSLLAFFGGAGAAAHDGGAGAACRAGMAQWMGVLHSITAGDAAAAAAARRRSGLLDGLLRAAGLVAPPERAAGGAPAVITQKGFQFVLAPTHVQLWTVLVQYLLAAGGGEADERRIGDGLLLLLRASLAPVGARLASDDGALLGLLVEMGLLGVGGAQAGGACATELAAQLCAKAAPADCGAQAAGGHIFVETNYRVYAYTSNALQVALLSLFTAIQGRFPNMVHGQLTAASVQGALARGITAGQVIAYLRAHLHPLMAGGQLPAVVEDQIYLWEGERGRLRTAAACLYDRFADEASFARALAEANRLGATLYVNYPRRLLAVKPEGHSALKAFIKGDGAF